MAYDKPGWAKRIEALEAVRDDMKANVLAHQYLHNTRHYTGGVDELTPANISAADRVHKHSYTDLTDLQALINGYAPGTNPAFPGGIGGIKDLDLTALADVLKSNYALGGGRLLLSNPGAASGMGRWLHVINGATPGKMLYVSRRSDRGTSGEAGDGSATITTNMSRQVSGLAVLRTNYTAEFRGPDLATVLATCDAYNGQKLEGSGSVDSWGNAALTQTHALMQEGNVSNSGGAGIAYGCLIVSPIIRFEVYTLPDWGTWYEVWEA